MLSQATMGTICFSRHARNANAVLFSASSEKLRETGKNVARQTARQKPPNNASQRNRNKSLFAFTTPGTAAVLGPLIACLLHIVLMFYSPTQ
jgi:hypothetical protein